VSKWKWSKRLPEVRVVVDAFRQRVDPPPAVEQGEAAPEPEPLPASPLDKLDKVEGKLAAAGFPALSAFWRETFEAWYAGFRRQLVVRVGRRGGKSSSLCRLLVLEALYGGHVIPPGDVGIAAVVSVDRKEAARRIMTVAAILDAIGARYEKRDGALHLVDRPIVVQPFTASIAGVSGGTCIFALCDEVAKWRDADTGANPATEVLRSLRPTMATQPRARIVLSSSPLGSLDAHAKAFDEGDTGFQKTASAPTWEANPTITEADTRELEPDEATRQREYGAVPAEGSVESIYAPVVLDGASRKGALALAARPGWSYVAAIDPATRGNAWTLVVATVDERGRRIVVLVHEWRGSKSKPVRSDLAFREMAGYDDPTGRHVPGLLEPYGVKRIWTDAWAFDPLNDHARKAGLILMMHSLTAEAKLLLHEGIARDMAVGLVELPPHADLRADLLSVHRVVTPNGRRLVLVVTPDGRHSDFAPSAGLALTQPCAAPRAVLETAAEREDAELLRRDKERYGGKSKPWWERERGASKRRRLG
jgi:hypothetical protein